MSMRRVFSCVVGRGCLLWPVRSLGKTLLAFALLHSILQGQICLFLRHLFLHPPPSLVFADCVELSFFGCKDYSQSDFDVDHLVMSMRRVFSCVVKRGCLLWPVHFLGKTLSLPCFILHSKAKFASYSRCFLTSYFCIPVPYNEKDTFFGC